MSQQKSRFGARLSPYRLGILQLLAGAVMISFSPVFVKLADVGPTVAGFYRTFFGAIFLVAFAVVRGDKLWNGRVPLALAIACGALFAGDLSFWHRSIEYIGPGLATIMGNFQVFCLAAFGVIVLRERVDWRLVLSIPLAVLGLFMIVGLDWQTLSGSYKRGVYFGLMTALTYATYVLTLQKSQSRGVRLMPAANLAIISLVTALIMGVEGRLQGESFVIPNVQSWNSLIAYGVLCQALGWIVISRALVLVPASRAGLVLLLQPTLAFLWDVIFFARPTGMIDVSGAVLALAAIYLGTNRRRESFRDTRGRAHVSSDRL